MSSPAELRKMLTHAIHQYGLTITAEDAAFWRQRIARLKQALARDTPDGGRADPDRPSSRGTPIRAREGFPRGGRS